MAAKAFPPFECSYRGSLLAGVDEVGRGPLAGPVIAAAVILNPENIPHHLNDSKKLSAKKRQELNDITPYEDFQKTVLHLGEKKLPNTGAERGTEQIAALQALLSPAIEAAMDNILQVRKIREDQLSAERKIEMDKITNLKNARLAHLETVYAENKDKRETHILTATRTFDNSLKWLEEAMTLEEHPFVQVIAVLING